jgi:hypothetical protein
MSLDNELTQAERQLLIYCLGHHKPELLSYVNKIETLKPEIINEMREAVGSEIMVKGFREVDQQSYEYGKKLENLIDRLADLYWAEDW